MERPLLLFRRGQNLPVSGPLDFSSGPYEATRSAVFRGSPQVTVGVNTVDWFPEELYCSGFPEAPTGLCEEHRISLRDIDGDPSFSQPPLEVVEIPL